MLPEDFSIWALHLSQISQVHAFSYIAFITISTLVTFPDRS